MYTRTIPKRKEVFPMMIYKNSGKGGFAVGSNKISREDLAAGGITAFALVQMALIGLAKPKKERKKGFFTRILSAPFLFKLAKAGVSKINLDSLVKKAENGEAVSTFFTDGFSGGESEEDTYAENIDENSDGVEVIPSTPIASEDEVYEHIR